jgi:hypothetical protein
MGVELMPDTIKIPALGEAPKKYVIGGVLIGGAIVVIVVIRGKKAAAAASAANANTAGSAGTSLVTDPAGNQCTALDPNSGYCPGSPEDEAYQESASGSYYGTDYGEDTGDDIGATGGISTAGLYVTDPAGNQCAAVDPSTGYCPGTPQDVAATTGTTATVPASSTSTAPTTNSAWLQDALQVLPGGDSSANEAALAGVLGGLTVTTAQQQIFLEAVGIIGQPPGGYPTPIKTSDTSAQPGAASKTAGPVTGLSVVPSGTGIQAKWNAAANATGGYSWQLTGAQSQSGKTTATTVTIHGLKKGAYDFGIQALPGGTGNNGHATVG